MYAFDQLESRLNSQITDVANKVGRFDTWMKQLEQVVAGRGRMGSTVGLSNELKGMDDKVIHDYCVSA
jgi:cytokinesis protein